VTSTLDIYCPASVLIRESGNVVSNVAFGSRLCKNAHAETFRATIESGR
jgi:hypothetical protein